jgi:hypothetical protein
MRSSSRPGRPAGAAAAPAARRFFLLAPLLSLVVPGGGAAPPDGAPTRGEIAFADGAYQVRPGQEVQAALELAAASGRSKLVRVHPGVYRPRRHGQALIWFNQRHDGITLEAIGEVTLSAANPDIADPDAPSYPAVVNHVVYFGDGISSATVLRGFRITGANGFVTRSDEGGAIERDLVLPELERGSFFYTDGGGIKIFGRSYPRLERLEIHDNFSNPCGGGISIEHRSFTYDAVVIRDTVFRGNRAQVTGSALDLLPGSRAVVENSLFVGNLSNAGPDTLSPPGREYLAERGSGALTVFKGSRVEVSRSTFTGNWNGVDDYGGPSVYRDSIFWRNDLGGGVSPGERYDLEILDGRGVEGCLIGSQDLHGTIDRQLNLFGGPDPRFDAGYVPRSPQLERLGYRPVLAVPGGSQEPAR